jgi:hypothetical protein
MPLTCSCHKLFKAFQQKSAEEWQNAYMKTEISSRLKAREDYLIYHQAHPYTWMTILHTDHHPQNFAL